MVSNLFEEITVLNFACRGQGSTVAAVKTRKSLDYTYISKGTLTNLKTRP